MPQPKTPLTKRQSYWLSHINAADASDGTLVAYATAHKLKVRDLYRGRPRWVAVAYCQVSGRNPLVLRSFRSSRRRRRHRRSDPVPSVP